MLTSAYVLSYAYERKKIRTGRFQCAWGEDGGVCLPRDLSKHSPQCQFITEITNVVTDILLLLLLNE